MTLDEWLELRASVNHDNIQNILLTGILADLERLRREGAATNSVDRPDLWKRIRPNLTSLQLEAENALSPAHVIDTSSFGNLAPTCRHWLRDTIQALYIATSEIRPVVAGLTSLSAKVDADFDAVQRERTIESLETLYEDLTALSRGITALPRRVVLP